MHSRKNLRSSRQDAQHSQQSVKWDVIESLLLDNTQADILAIMDTKFIANETNAEGYTGRAFQLIAASPPDHTLADPGPNSFTCAMIQVLNEWLDEDGGRLSSWKLGERINDKPSRISNPCFLQNRLQNGGIIYLAPLKDKEAQKRKEEALNTNPIADLMLRFSLGIRSLTKEHIDILTKELPKACVAANVRLQRIDWISLEERTPNYSSNSMALASGYGKLWLQKTRERKGNSFQKGSDIDLAQVSYAQHSTRPTGMPTLNRFEIEYQARAISRWLLQDQSIRSLISILSKSSIPREAILEDITTHLGVLGRELIEEASDMGEKSQAVLVKSYGEHLAFPVWKMITTTRPDTNHAECVETNSFIPSSRAFERFKEDLLDFFGRRLDRPIRGAYPSGNLSLLFENRRRYLLVRPLKMALDQLWRPLRQVGIVEEPLDQRRWRLRWRCVSGPTDKKHCSLLILSEELWGTSV